MDPTTGSQRTSISAWYSDPDITQGTNDILYAAAEHAKVLLRPLITKQEFEHLFASTSQQSNASFRTFSVPKAQNPLLSDPEKAIFEVQERVEAAKALYEDRISYDEGNTSSPGPSHNVLSQSRGTSRHFLPSSNKWKLKARYWLNNLSEKLVYYGNIFDVLVQHHPEYVSLAWGAFKLLFTAVVNHAETISKLSQSISEISEILPQHQLHLILYPTPQMQTAVARLYAYILRFFVSSLQWYRAGQGLHALKSVFQPWDLKFKPEFEAIAVASRNIERLAEVASKAELRDTRLEVVKGTQHWDSMQREMEDLKSQNARLIDLVNSKFGFLESSLLNMYQDIRFDFASQRTILNRVHLNQMLSLPFWNSLPTSGDALQFCQSMRARHRIATFLASHDLQKFESWTSAQSGSPILFFDSRATVAAKTFLVDVLNLMRESKQPIVWALRYADYHEQRLTMSDVIRILVIQAMQVASTTLLETAFPVTVEQLREASSLGDWIAILTHLLQPIDHLFVFLDTDLLSHVTENSKSEVMDLLDVLRDKLSGKIKIVVASSCVSPSYTSRLQSSNSCVSVQVSSSLDVRFRHHRQQRGSVRRMRAR